MSRQPISTPSTGGERGIRTLDRVSPIHAFQACAFNHSAISPAQLAVPNQFNTRVSMSRRCGLAEIQLRAGDRKSIESVAAAPAANGREQEHTRYGVDHSLLNRRTSFAPTAAGTRDDHSGYLFSWYVELHTCRLNRWRAPIKASRNDRYSLAPAAATKYRRRATHDRRRPQSGATAAVRFRLPAVHLARHCGR